MFPKKKLTLKSPTTVEALPTIKRFELIDKKEFATVAINKDSETFVVHMTSIMNTMSIHPARAAQIAALQADKALTEVPTEYSDYVNVFSPNLAMELPENMGMNEHAIELIDGKQPSYGPIYAFSLVELETLKAYIKTHLKTGFLQPFKSLAGAPILFNKSLTAASACVSIIKV